MASLSDTVALGSDGIRTGCGGGNPGGTLGKGTGIWDALTFLILLIRVTNTFKYPSGTSSRWSRDLVSNRFSNALSSSGVHLMVDLSSQASSSIGVLPAALSMVVPPADSKLGIDVSWLIDS